MHANEVSPMQAKSVSYTTSLFILPVLFALFYAFRVLLNDYAISDWFPRWSTVSAIFTMIILERIYR